jgi:hypothetical protein
VPADIADPKAGRKALLLFSPRSNKRFLSAHWAANCWILKCCVDDKELEYCYECELFPCGRLSEWAGEREQYAEALKHLQQMGGRAKAG